jgi:hypothetical protein
MTSRPLAASCCHKAGAGAGGEVVVELGAIVRAGSWSQSMGVLADGAPTYAARSQTSRVSGQVNILFPA